MKQLLFVLILVNCFQYLSGQDSILLVKACSIDTFFTNRLVARSWKMSEANEQLCKKLLYANAQQNARIYLGNSNDPFVRFAVAGVTGNGIVCILLNEANLESYNFDPRMTFTFIAHELGHINHFHYVKKEPLDSTDELNADFYSGFCSAREGFTNEQSTQAFKLLHRSKNDIHPPYESRKARILQGYQHLTNPSPYPSPWLTETAAVNKINKKLINKINSIKAHAEDFEDTTYSDLLGKYLSAVCIIRPLGASTRTNKEWYSFSLSIQSNHPSLPNDSLMSYINNVRYGLHETFPGEKFRVSDNRASNFEFSIPAWGDFDIPVIVSFKDESIASFVYKLRLQSGKNNPEQDQKSFLSP